MVITKDTPVEDILSLGKSCQRKNHCCRFGSGFLVREDHKRLAGLLNVDEEKLKKEYLEEKELFNTVLYRPKVVKKGKPYGSCMFFDGQGCKVHEAKPLMCRVGNCGEHSKELTLWFNLNHFLNPADPESVRQYAAYLKAGGETLPGAGLDDIVPDKKRLARILNFEILR